MPSPISVVAAYTPTSDAPPSASSAVPVAASSEPPMITVRLPSRRAARGVTEVDAEHRPVTVADREGFDRLDYDTLLYTLASTAASVAGATGRLRAQEHDVALIDS